MKLHFAVTSVLLVGSLHGAPRSHLTPTDLGGGEWRAVCMDGHGPLHPGWLPYDEANRVGKDHEWRTKGHRWDMRQR